MKIAAICVESSETANRPGRYSRPTDSRNDVNLTNTELYP